MAEKSRNASTDALDDVASSGKVHASVVIGSVYAVCTISVLVVLKIFEELPLCSSIPTTAFGEEHHSMFEEANTLICCCLPLTFCSSAGQECVL